MKVKIGNDEFCLYCMEWREYDEAGRCKVCKHIIHRIPINKKEVDYETDSDSSSYEEFDENSDDFNY